jgi:hypothetical protein
MAASAPKFGSIAAKFCPKFNSRRFNNNHNSVPNVPRSAIVAVNAAVVAVVVVAVVDHVKLIRQWLMRLHHQSLRQTTLSSI